VVKIYIFIHVDLMQSHVGNNVDTAFREWSLFGSIYLLL